MTAPALDAGRRRRAVDDRQDAGAVQFDERGMLELRTRVRPRAGRHRLEHRAVRQLIQKLVQVSLERLHGLLQGEEHDEDRKSTRLNSSHQIISYAVFCLKKKKNEHSRNADTATTPMY